MKNSLRWLPFLLVAGLCASALATAGSLLLPLETARGTEGVAAAAGPKPVEEDMHEFMEYVFEPAYKRLKPAMAAAPENNAGWKVIKGESLVLAEAGNLLLLRAPEEDAADWNALSAEVRDLGGALYQAGKAKDFAKARSAYEGMIRKCNACHDKFAGGEHQLEP